MGFSLLDHEYGYCILTPSSQEYIQYIYNLKRIIALEM